MGKRPMRGEVSLGLGKRTRLHRVLHGHGPGNGTMLLLAADAGLEMGPGAFAAHPESNDPAYAPRLALEGGCSAVMLGIGLAARAMGEIAGRVPLVLKLNGKTDIPQDDEALAPLNATVEEAVGLGADAVAYTLYVGSPAQYEDLTQLSSVRRDCQALGMPLLLLATPRGSAIERRGGAYGLYAQEYAARVAAEVGADLVALHGPVTNPRQEARAPAPYNSLHLDPETALRRVVESAGGIPVLIEVGGASVQEDLLTAARQAMAAGATGVILDRGPWEHPLEQAVALVHQVRELLGQFQD